MAPTSPCSASSSSTSTPAGAPPNEYQRHLRDQDVGLLETIIPRRVGVTVHARYGRPTVLLEPDGVVAHAYRAAAAEIAARLSAHHGLSTTSNRGGGSRMTGDPSHAPLPGR